MRWLRAPVTDTQVTRGARLWLYALAILVMAFLVIPTVIVVPMSFSGSQYLEFPPRVWSLRWYDNYFGSASWMAATATSFKAATLTTLVATPLGTMAAYGLFVSQFRFTRIIVATLLTPIIVPVILVGIAIVSGVGLTWLLHGTRVGKLLLTVIHDPEVSRAMGINVDRFYLVTFTFGSMLAAVGGAFTAPTMSVVPGIGVEIVVLSFAVVVIGGLGSLPGAALGAVIVGLVRSAAIHYAPAVELFVIYFVMALVLAFRPRGLFSLAEPRKI